MNGALGVGIFIFNRLQEGTHSDRKIITDFNRNEDMIQISKLNIAFSHLAISEQADDTLISHNGSGFEFNLVGTGHELSASNFIV